MTLPNMPIRYGDPGVFACKISDGAPEPPRPGRHLAAAPPQAPTGVWLVLALCAHCSLATGRYCHLHDMRIRRG